MGAATQQTHLTVFRTINTKLEYIASLLLDQISAPSKTLGLRTFGSLIQAKFGKVGQLGLARFESGNLASMSKVRQLG